MNKRRISQISTYGKLRTYHLQPSACKTCLFFHSCYYHFISFVVVLNCPLDASSFELFAGYCGLALHYSQVWMRIKKIPDIHITLVRRFSMTSRQPYWCPKIMTRIQTLSLKKGGGGGWFFCLSCQLFFLLHVISGFFHKIRGRGRAGSDSQAPPLHLPLMLVSKQSYSIWNLI